MIKAATLIATAILAPPAATCAASGGVPYNPARTVMDLIDILDRAEPVTRGKVAKAIGKKLKCQGFICGVDNVTLSDVTISHVDRRGSLLKLEKFSGGCVSVEKIVARYAGGNVSQSCTDGVTCLYYGVKRPWGRLSVRLPDDGSLTSCASSVIFDTAP